MDAANFLDTAYYISSLHASSSLIHMVLILGTKATVDCTPSSDTSCPKDRSYLSGIPQ